MDAVSMTFARHAAKTSTIQKSWRRASLMQSAEIDGVEMECYYQLMRWSEWPQRITDPAHPAHGADKSKAGIPYLVESRLE
jgi:hypothetical protein